MRLASEVQRKVLEELAAEAGADPPAISVGVSDGVVTLRGQVESFSARRAAEQAAARVTGVQEVVNDLAIVRVPSSGPDGAAKFRRLSLRPLPSNR